MANETHCMRCQRENPNTDSGNLPLDWEVQEDEAGNVVGVLCAGCITGQEEQAIDEDMLETASAVQPIALLARAQEELREAQEALELQLELSRANGDRERELQVHGVRSQIQSAEASLFLLEEALGAQS